VGRTVASTAFTAVDYARFRAELEAETARLERWFADGRFAGGATTVGYELEACLVDADYAPADANATFLARLDMPEAVPELARSNVEFNGRARGIGSRGLERLHAELDDWFARGRRVAADLDLKLVLIGVLPTLEERHLTLEHISPSDRYRALNATVAARRGRPYVEVAIHGREIYRGYYDSIMAESAATSFQMHISLPPKRAVRCYNAAVIASGPLLAVAANAPYLFGYDLWAETRIPVFAQSVDTGDVNFVTFGRRYVGDSLFELFAENRDRFPVLLPAACEPGGIEHLLLHNGTIWRWNRPIVGGDRNVGEPPRLRLEHRALPSGPSVLDMIANCAFFYGLTWALSECEPPPEGGLSFGAARANFYRAAREGMAAELHWFDGEHPATRLFEERLLPLARTGLAALSVDADLAQRYLDVIAARVARGLSGAGWQRAWVARHGRDMAAMLAAYAERQASGAPVSEWSLD
jgi:hypothetical protein